MQFLIVASLLVGALVSAAPKVGEPMELSSRAGGHTRQSNYCVGEHNRVRSQNGLAQFTADRRLEAAAERHNQVMVDQDCFSHQCPGEPSLGDRVDQQGYNWSGIAENIANGYSNCQAAVEGWMNSDGHRRNILANYRHIGCHRNGRYYTCVFGNEM